MSLSLLSTILLNGSSSVPVDARRLALESSSADWFRWVTWYGYAVAVGCTMEVWEVSITIKNWWLLRFRNVEVEEDKKSWASPIAAIGLLIIVAGIVLETYCEGRVADAETELRNHFSEKLTTAEEEAADAIRDAGTAKDSAVQAAMASDRAISSADLAGGIAKSATTDAKSAQASSLEAQQHATVIGNELTNEIEKERATEQELEGEKVKRLKLAVSLRDRELFDQSRIITRLSSLPPHRVVFVYLNEREPRNFAQQIAFIFSILKWPFFGRPLSDDSLIRPGVSISSGDLLPPLKPNATLGETMGRLQQLRYGMDLAETLKAVFGEAHVDLAANQHTEGSENEPPSTIFIGVGPKPNTELEEALGELGAPEATPLGGGAKGLKLWGNTISIPLDPSFKPNSGKP